MQKSNKPVDLCWVAGCTNQVSWADSKVARGALNTAGTCTCAAGTRCSTCRDVDRRWDPEVAVGHRNTVVDMLPRMPSRHHAVEAADSDG